MLLNQTWVYSAILQQNQFTETSFGEGMHSIYLQGAKQGKLAAHDQKSQTPWQPSGQGF